MKNRVNSKFLTGMVLAVSAILFLLVNLSSNTFLRAFRLDLTANKIYTLSKGSKQIIAEMQEPILLRYYFSKKLSKDNPYLVSFAERVRDLLHQYQRVSDGKILLEVIDPEPFSEDEDEAVNYGLQGVPVNSEGHELYFGLVGTGSTSEQQVIAFFQPSRESNLEYDITQLVYNLAHPEPKVIGLISALPLTGGQHDTMHPQNIGKPWVIWQHLNQHFDIRELQQDIEEVPTEVKTLMLVNPTNFSAKLIQAIDDYVMRGGHILAFIDPYTEVESADSYLRNLQQQQQTTAADSKIDALLASWGVKLEQKKVVAARDIAKHVRFTHEGREQAISYPIWMDLVADNFNQQDILTGNLERLTIATPGSLQPIEDSSTTFIPLFETSEDAMLVDTNIISSYRNNPRLLARDYKPAGRKFTLAARITGKISSAFSEQSVDTANIIIIADADMLHDHFWINAQNLFGQRYDVPTSGNGSFILSALDNLSGSNALISIRNQGSFVRPFDRIRAIEARSQELYLAAEKQLLDKLELTKKKLSELEMQKQQGTNLLASVQQKQEEDIFRNELIHIRKQLREVRHQLNRDIENLEFGIKFFSIGLLPLLILFGSFIFWFVQVQKARFNRFTR